MKRVLTVFGATLIGSTLAACSGGAKDESSAGSTMRVQGTVSQELAVDNARAVAVGNDGRTVWTYLDGHRDFSLKLPLGQSYRIFIANQRSGGGQNVAARLVLDGAGGRTEWLGANRDRVVSLGTLRPGAGADLTRSLRPSCSGCESTDGEAEDESTHEDDLECTTSDESPFDDEEQSACGGCEATSDDDKDDDESNGKAGEVSSKDDEKSCSLCKEADEVEVKPSKSPSGCEDKQKDQHAGKKGSTPVKPCADKGSAKTPGKGDSKSGDDGKGGKTGGDDEGKGTGEGQGTDESKSSGGGGKGGGSSCKTTTECTSTCACVASKCAVK